MKAVSIVGVLVFLLVTVGSASADLVLTEANIRPGSIQIDVINNTGNSTITFLDQSTGVNNPGIVGIGYNLDVDAQQITGYEMNSNTGQVLYDAVSEQQNKNKWMQTNNFGSESEFGNFLRFYDRSAGEEERFYKVVVKLPSFDGNIPGNSRGNQLAVHYACDQFTGFVTGPGNGGTPNENLAMSLEKSAFPATYDTAGQTITYNYVVKNTGNVPITGLTVTDDKLGVVSRSSTILEPNNSTTVMVSYTITQADINAGSVTNVANATGTYKGSEIKSNSGAVTVTANTSALNFENSAPQMTYSATYDNLQVNSNDETGTTIPENLALSLVKSASPTNYSFVGQTIAYNYLVNNTENVPITILTIMDDKCEVSVPSITLGPGQNVTGTANYTITQADIDAGYVINLANVTGTYNGVEVKSNNYTVKIAADAQIPEFPSIVLPVVAILGLMFISQRKRREE